ncbi:MAG: hypothetical protein JOZ39_10160 [Chloroflexi bacterium]|nr:hypothetical protein [Chloroflexota bacterium]
MVCVQVRPALLLPETGQRDDLQRHLAECAPCGRLAAALSRLDGAVARAVRAPELPEQVTSMAFEPVLMERVRSEVRIEGAIRAQLLQAPPLELETRLAAIAAAPARLDAALSRSLVVEPPLPLQAKLGQLVGAEVPLWQRILGVLQPGGSLTARLGVLAAEFAAVLLLIYASFQLFSWLGSQVVLGDVPYAIELLLWSPAVDYLAQLQPLLQQLGLWLLVAAAGWVVARGVPGRDRSPVA